MKKNQIKTSKPKYHKHKSYVKKTLVWTILFFMLTYAVINNNTIIDQLGIIFSVGKIFTGKTVQALTDEQFKAQNDKETYQIEQEIFQLINLIRIENNLNQLEWDPFLGKLAREHSIDMAEHNYFNHTNLIGQNPSQRAKTIGIRTKIITEKKIYTGVSENIGKMPRGIVENVGVIITTKDIAAAAVYEWMNSKPHRENILEKELFFTGIGVAYDGNGNFLLTQNFQ
jgi:uncharacterized protein YkwD